MFHAGMSWNVTLKPLGYVLLESGNWQSGHLKEESPGQRTSKDKGTEEGGVWHFCQRAEGQGPRRPQPERLSLL